MAKRTFGKVALAAALGVGLQLAGASAAQAAKILPSSGSTPFSGSSMTVYGAGHGTIDNTSLDEFKPNFQHGDAPDGVAAVPEPAAWLTMLLGFGVIGAVTRRGGRTTMQVQHGH